MRTHTKKGFQKWGGASNLNALKGLRRGFYRRVIKGLLRGNARSLDYGSYIRILIVQAPEKRPLADARWRSQCSRNRNGKRSAA